MWIKRENGNYYNTQTEREWSQQGSGDWFLSDHANFCNVIDVSEADFEKIRKALESNDAAATDAKTLRDKIARDAMKGLLSNSGGVVQANSHSGTGYCNTDAQGVAAWAYDLADAMLKERENDWNA